MGYIEFFERITDMMERIGAHLAYLTRYCETSFQLSDQLQKVFKLQCMKLNNGSAAHSVLGPCRSILRSLGFLYSSEACLF